MQATELVAKLRAETGEYFSEDYFEYCFKLAIKIIVQGCHKSSRIMELVYHDTMTSQFYDVIHIEDGAPQETFVKKAEAMLLMISTAVNIALAVEKQFMEEIKVEEEPNDSE